ncbi:unnamed protein product [Rotaria sp. Silwood1]|nr:unnamed protein product [Rotaria sp. Silwood1]CAF1581271.1 unnamed protein product [Rotaria sp. Silwood1]
MPLRVRNLLEEVGDELILKIQLGRTPVQDFPLKILDFLSHSKFTNKQLELGYDEIYHNYLLITIQNSRESQVLQHILGNARQNKIPSTILKLEKAQRIALKYPSIPDELIDIYDIPLTRNKPLTLNRLISVASNVDKNFFKYDAGENNMCQTFVENIIDINGLMSNIVDEATLNALKPIDAKALISSLGSRSNIVKIATDLGAKFDKLVFDRKIKWKKSQPKDFALMRSTNATDSESTDAIYNTILQLEKNTLIFAKKSGAKGLKDSRMKSIALILRDKSNLSSNDTTWTFGYEHVSVRRWMFSRNQVNPIYNLPVVVLINHTDGHIYRALSLTDNFLDQWMPRNRPYEESKRHLPGNQYKLTWQDRVFTRFLRYMFVAYFHCFAPRIHQLTHSLTDHWSNYLWDKHECTLNDAAAIFICRGDKMPEDSFCIKYNRWRNISMYVKGLVDKEQELNQTFSSVFIMTDDVSVMNSIQDYANPNSTGIDEPYARKHLRNRQLMYNIFASQACFDPFNRIGFEQFLVSTEFIIQYAQFTVGHSDSNVGRYLEEIIYVQNQLKASVQSNSFVTNASDSL